MMDSGSKMDSGSADPPPDEVSDIFEPESKCYEETPRNSDLKDQKCLSQSFNTPFSLLMDVSSYSSLEEIDNAKALGGLDKVLEDLRPIFDIARKNMINKEAKKTVTDMEMLDLVLFKIPEGPLAEPYTLEDFGGDEAMMEACGLAIFNTVLDGIALFLCFIGLSTIGKVVGRVIAGATRFNRLIVGRIKSIFGRVSNINSMIAQVAMAVFQWAIETLSFATITQRILEQLSWWDAIGIAFELGFLILAALTSGGVSYALQVTACLVSMALTIAQAIPNIVRSCPD